jgi:hypothetical protein
MFRPAQKHNWIRSHTSQANIWDHFSRLPINCGIALKHHMQIAADCTKGMLCPWRRLIFIGTFPKFTGYRCFNWKTPNI